VETLFFIIILMIFGFYSYPAILWLLFIAIYSVIFYDVGVYFWIVFITFSIFILNEKIRQNFIIIPILKYLKSNEINFKIFKNIFYFNEHTFLTNTFKSYKEKKLTKEENDFLRNDVEKLFIFENNRYLDFIKNKKLFALCIPKEYAGLGFSFFSYLKIIEKFAFHCSSLNINDILINSINSSKILLKYGTKKQKEYYLPKIAKEEEIIEFIFTKTNFKGEVFKDANEELKIKLEFNFKDYNNISTLIIVAFDLYDPKHLILKNTNLVTTFALINIETIKNTNSSENLTINYKDIIGEPSHTQNQKSFIKSLFFYKKASFLSLCIGQSKSNLKLINSYSSLKDEYEVSKKEIKEIEEKIAKIVSFNYLSTNLRNYFFSINKDDSNIDFFNHIINYHISKNFKKIAFITIDILDSNKFQKIKKRVYEFIEYSNNLDKSSFDFEHIFIKNKSIVIIDKTLQNYISSSINANIKSFIFFLTRGYFIKVDKELKRHKKSLIWVSTNFNALLNFSSLLSKKRKKIINEKLIDIFSWIHLLKLIIKENEDNQNSNYKFLVDYICQYGFYQIQKEKENIFQEIPTFKILLPFIRLNPYALKPNNKINTKIIKFIKNRENLDEICASLSFLKDNNKTIFFELDEALKLQNECEDLHERIKYAIKHKTLKKNHFSETIKQANKTGVITKKEYEKLDFAYKKRLNLFT